MSDESLAISDFFYIIVMIKTLFSFQNFSSRLKSPAEHCEPINWLLSFWNTIGKIHSRKCFLWLFFSSNLRQLILLTLLMSFFKVRKTHWFCHEDVTENANYSKLLLQKWFCKALVHGVYTSTGGLLISVCVIGATFQSCSLHTGLRFGQDAIFFILPNSPQFKKK